MEKGIADDFRHKTKAKSRFIREVKAISALFHFNEFELAAWHCVLTDFFAAHPKVPSVLLMLWVAAFHAKSAISIGGLLECELLKREDPKLTEHFKAWHRFRRILKSLSMRRINESYKQLLSHTQKSNLASTTSKIVDELVGTQTVDSSLIEQERTDQNSDRTAIQFENFQVNTTETLSFSYVFSDECGGEDKAGRKDYGDEDWERYFRK